MVDLPDNVIYTFYDRSEYGEGKFGILNYKDLLLMNNIQVVSGELEAESVDKLLDGVIEEVPIDF